MVDIGQCEPNNRPHVPRRSRDPNLPDESYSLVRSDGLSIEVNVCELCGAIYYDAESSICPAKLASEMTMLWFR